MTPRIVGIVLDVPDPVVSVAPPITPAVTPSVCYHSIANHTRDASAAEKEAHGVYTVQVGAFDSQAEAQALDGSALEEIRQRFIDKVSTGPAFYHVRVGHLVFMEEARTAAKTDSQTASKPTSER